MGGYSGSYFTPENCQKLCEDESRSKECVGFLYGTAAGECSPSCKLARAGCRAADPNKNWYFDYYAIEDCTPQKVKFNTCFHGTTQQK